jgi:phage terminase large subunit
MEDTRKQYQRGFDTQIVDSADAAIRNQMSYQYGIDLDPGKKLDKKQMIQYVQDLFSTGRVRVINSPRNQIWLQEHKRYRTKEDSDEVIKKHDHTCDNFQYYVVSNLNKLGLGD